MTTENKITRSKNALVMLPSIEKGSHELRSIQENFCGTTVSSLSEVFNSNFQKIYVCGDLAKVEQQGFEICVIKEISLNYEHLDQVQVVNLGEVPLVMHGAGVYFKKLFPESNYFNVIQSEHVFQELTESTKQSKALRKGIYLSKVSKEKVGDNSEVLHFHLLRCSSNLTGPTDNFRKTDLQIVKTLNDQVQTIFEKETELNHVLAQVYENNKLPSGKEKKAKIKAHSDKTKDMPQEGLIAFCTFYDESQFKDLRPSKKDPYDWVFNETSGLSRLVFKLKSTVEDETLAKEFSVTLYPNSAFVIPLSTNRLYTHEIKPSVLNVDKIPTRMGYVARCSNLEAQYIDSEVYIKEAGELLKLEPMTTEMMSELRSSYFKENVSEEMIQYKKVRFSMNSGDYQKPLL